MRAWDRHLQRRGDAADELVERHRLLARDNECLSGCRGMLRAEEHAVNQIVDIGHVVERLASTQHDEAPAGNEAEELQEASVAWSVDPDGPHDHAGEPVLEIRHRQSLALALAPLIAVARAERI